MKRSVSTREWKQDYTFDRYGNRNFIEANTTTIPKNCGTSPNLTVCPADRKVFNPSIAMTNRINLDQDGDSVNDYAFDSSGNTTKDANGRTFVYDAENKQVEVKNASDETIGKYWYDGDGRRVKKRGWINGQWEETIFVYDASSRLVAEYSTILNPTPQVAYLTNDHLGSPRINTDENGAVISRHDYRPYGEEVTERTHAEYVADTIRKQFTGYERDDETDLDFAQARMYGVGIGRFSTPDEVINDTDPQAPQSWNLFVYVRNNPLKYVDPSGEEIWISFDEEEEYEEDGVQKKRTVTRRVQYRNGTLLNEDGSEYTGSNRYALNAMNFLNELMEDPEGRFGRIISTLENSREVHTITQDPRALNNNETVPDSWSDARRHIATGSTIYWSGQDQIEGRNGLVPAYVTLAHELSHAFDFDQGIDDSNNEQWRISDDPAGRMRFIFVNVRERIAIELENEARALGGIGRRGFVGEVPLNYDLPKIKSVENKKKKKKRR